MCGVCTFSTCLLGFHCCVAVSSQVQRHTDYSNWIFPVTDPGSDESAGEVWGDHSFCGTKWGRKKHSRTAHAALLRSQRGHGKNRNIDQGWGKSHMHYFQTSCHTNFCYSLFELISLHAFLPRSPWMVTIFGVWISSGSARSSASWSRSRFYSPLPSRRIFATDVLVYLTVTSSKPPKMRTPTTL